MGRVKNSRPLKSEIADLCYNVEGVTKADLGLFDEALEFFTKAIAEDPSNFVAYFNRASIKMRLGDIEGARHDFKKSETLDNQESWYS